MNRAATGAAADAAADPTGAPSGAGAAGAGAVSAGAVSAAALDGEGAPSGTGADAGGSDAGRGPEADEWRPGDAPPEDLVRRNPPRDWAAPPPWLASNDARRDPDAEPPPFLGRRAVAEPGQGLAGSPADRFAGGAPPTRSQDPSDGDWSSESRAAAATGAGLAASQGAPGPATSAGAGRRAPVDEIEQQDFEDEPRRPARRPRAYAQHLGGTDGPDWERPRRSEAYPTIRSRVAMPQVPRVAAMAIGVVVLALALFFLVPSLLNLGGSGGGPRSSPSPSAVGGPSASLAPTVPPAPTPSLYTIKKNDNLSKIAKAHGITLDELLRANPAIKNPNAIAEGQQIVIPVAGASAPDTIGGSPSPS